MQKGRHSPPAAVKPPRLESSRHGQQHAGPGRHWDSAPVAHVPKAVVGGSGACDAAGTAPVARNQRWRRVFSSRVGTRPHGERHRRLRPWEPQPRGSPTRLGLVHSDKLQQKGPREDRRGEGI
ncbi:hypothetical protein HJG60_008525 [Phyllostomus discolor]|uniref:Uncharacterized protein n=1 Tax=Phyllostomus discolor TaxID=89673 RepID=A0A834DKD4_9CHIR|nr:hypothetical protein HJG60_008525 [Phyllostomus discolor]